MSEDDPIAEIREQKREELLNEAEQTVSTSAPVHVSSSADFEEIVSGDGVVLVDFHADWCGPCKMLEPVVEELAAETDATVAKVDVDAHQQLAGQYGVQSVPTLLLFAGGEPVERMVGVQDKESLAAAIAQHA